MSTQKNRKKVQSPPDSLCPLTVLVTRSMRRELQQSLLTDGLKFSAWIRPLLQARIAGKRIIVQDATDGASKRKG